MTSRRILRLHSLFAALILPLAADPLACQPNTDQPMLPTFHVIGNVSKNADGSVTVEQINDCSGITYHQGVYHLWHQVGVQISLDLPSC